MKAEELDKLKARFVQQGGVIKHPGKEAPKRALTCLVTATASLPDRRPNARALQAQIIQPGGEATECRLLGRSECLNGVEIGRLYRFAVEPFTDGPYGRGNVSWFRVLQKPFASPRAPTFDLA